MAKFNHQVSIAFTVIGDSKWIDQIPPHVIKAALLARIADLDKCQEWHEAISTEDVGQEEEG
jgi:hypothetical protein